MRHQRATAAHRRQRDSRLGTLQWLYMAHWTLLIACTLVAPPRHQHRTTRPRADHEHVHEHTRTRHTQLSNTPRVPNVRPECRRRSRAVCARSSRPGRAAEPRQSRAESRPLDARAQAMHSLGLLWGVPARRGTRHGGAPQLEEPAFFDALLAAAAPGSTVPSRSSISFCISEAIVCSSSSKSHGTSSSCTCS